MKGKDGGTLPAGTSFSFTVADGDTLRLQELLAELDYLPLSFTPAPAAPAPASAAMPQFGTLRLALAEPPGHPHVAVDAGRAETSSPRRP